MEEKYTWIEPWSLTFTLLSYLFFLEFRVTPSSVHGNLGLTEVHGNLDPVQAVVCEGIFTFILVCSIYGCTDSNRPMFGSPAVGIGLTIAVVHLAAVSRHRCALKRHPPRPLHPHLYCFFRIWKWFIFWLSIQKFTRTSKRVCHATPGSGYVG